MSKSSILKDSTRIDSFRRTAALCKLTTIKRSNLYANIARIHQMIEQERWNQLQNYMDSTVERLLDEKMFELCLSLITVVAYYFFKAVNQSQSGKSELLLGAEDDDDDDNGSDIVVVNPCLDIGVIAEIDNHQNTCDKCKLILKSLNINIVAKNMRAKANGQEKMQISSVTKELQSKIGSIFKDSQYNGLKDKLQSIYKLYQTMTTKNRSKQLVNNNNNKNNGNDNNRVDGDDISMTGQECVEKIELEMEQLVEIYNQTIKNVIMGQNCAINLYPINVNNLKSEIGSFEQNNEENDHDKDNGNNNDNNNNNNKNSKNKKQKCGVKRKYENKDNSSYDDLNFLDDLSDVDINVNGTNILELMHENGNRNDNSNVDGLPPNKRRRRINIQNKHENGQVHIHLHLSVLLGVTSPI